MDKKSCFVIMPFSKTTDAHTESYWTSFFEVIKREIEFHNYICKRSETGPYNIPKHIIQCINESDFVIAVLTDLNPNVWYELGIRHSLKNGTLMLMQSDQRIPFDISSYGLVKYSDDITLASALKKEINLYLNKLEENKHYDSPVLDLLNLPSDKQDKIDGLYELVLKLSNEKAELKIGDIQKSQTNYNRILWVDDYPSNNQIVISMFERKNIRFDIAIDTAQGLSRISENYYDLIITDMGRREGEDAGLVLIKEINKLNIKNIPPIVVFSSGRAIANYGRAALDLGAVATLNGIGEIVSFISQTLGIK